VKLYIKGIGLEFFSAANWWLRSPNADNSNNAGNVNTSGNVNNNNVNNNYAARPALPYSRTFAPSGADLCKPVIRFTCIRQRNPIPFRARVAGVKARKNTCRRNVRTRTG
jgi:hypothetical protein